MRPTGPAMGRKSALEHPGSAFRCRHLKPRASALVATGIVQTFPRAFDNVGRAWANVNRTAVTSVSTSVLRCGWPASSTHTGLGQPCNGIPGTKRLPSEKELDGRGRCRDHVQRCKKHRAPLECACTFGQNYNQSGKKCAASLTGTSTLRPTHILVA